MLRRSAVLLTTAACFAVTGCSSSDSAGDADGSSSPTLSAAEARQACVDAWAIAIGSQPTGWAPEMTDQDAVPAECLGLSVQEYTELFSEGLEQSKQKDQ
ncbi:hypothetical protein ACFU3O_23880 [Streptomyces antibioticus]|uniref:hypothetical protein n=1 Tax=Streptomyces antibioticus TaxID=1890 RepID=UPI0033B0E5FD